MAVVLEGVNTAIEHTRDLTVDGVLHVAQATVQYHRESVRKGAGAIKKERGRDHSHAFTPLDNHPLSFYDKFLVINGIPAFLLGKRRKQSGPISQPDLPGKDIPKTPQEITSFWEREIRAHCDATVVEPAPCTITDCRFSMDSSRFVTGHYDGTVRVWNTNHGTSIGFGMKILAGPLASVSFKGESNDIIVCSDWTGKYCIWGLGETDSYTVVDCSHMWVGGRVIRSEIVDDGNKLVLAVRVPVEKQLKLQIQDRKNGGRVSVDLDQEVSVFVLDTVGYQEEPLGVARVPFRDGKELSTVMLMPDGDGLLVGWIDKYLREGSVVYWPDYTSNAPSGTTLEGVMACVAPDASMTVTWNPPVDIPLQDARRRCCFVYQTAKLKDLASHPTGIEVEKYPMVLKDPRGKHILCASFVQGIRREEECVKLATVGLAHEIHVVIWDLKSEVPTHVLNTGVSASSTNLRNVELWEERWMRGVAIKGLKPVGTSMDGSWMGFMSGQSNEGVIWDAKHCVEMLRLRLPKDVINELDGEVDIVFGRNPGKFAIVGREKVLIMNARSPECEPDFGAQVVSLRYMESLVEFHQPPICHFSKNGDKLGHLHPFSNVMHVWDLDCGTCSILENDAVNSYAPFCNFGFSEDGTRLVTVTQDRAIMLWMETVCRGWVGIGQVGVLEENASDLSPCKAIAISKPDEMGRMMVVACETSGMLVWFAVTETTVIEHMSPIALQKVRRYQSMQGNSSLELATPSSKNLKGQIDEAISSAAVSPRGKFRGILGHFGTRSSRVAADKQSGQTSRQSVEQPWAFGEEVARKPGEGQYACQFSSDGCRGVLMPNSRRVVVWDLVRREVVQQLDYMVPMGEQGPFLNRLALNGEFAVIGQKHHSDEIVICKPDTSFVELKGQVGKTAGAFVVAENSDWIVSNDFTSLPLGTSSATPRSGMTRQDSLMLVDRLFITHRHGKSTKKYLQGSRLDPSRMLVISPDGRRVACMTDKASITVWSAYGAEGLVPDYGWLKVCEMTESKAHLLDLVGRFGPAVMNYKDACGGSLFLHAVNEQNIDMVKILLGYARNKEIKVRLREFGCGVARGVFRIPEISNAVELAIHHRSPDVARQIIKAMLAGVAHDRDNAEIFRMTLVTLGSMYPRILREVLDHEEMVVNICTVQVPEDSFAERKFLTLTDLRMRPQESVLRKMWVQRANKYSDGQDSVMVPAIAKVIPYPNAANVGSEGVLRALLMNRASAEAYGADPIRMIITHKWRSYGRRMLFTEMLHYLIMVISFSAYSLIIGRWGWDFDRFKAWRNVGHATLVLSSFLAFLNLVRELKQMHTYWSENGLKGVVFWIKSGWNWVELTSYILLIVVTPIAHFHKGHQTIDLSTVVAVESILLWWKVLYYAKAFKPTGPLVIMISEILGDITFFLILAGMVLIGFGTAFYVLYQDVRDQEMEIMDNMGDALEAFGSIRRTFMTMFGYMLGDFDLPVLYEADNPEIAMVLFVLYMGAMAVLLLNLLIAIMGDSFDRIKNTEDTQFLKARASAIDDVESMMSEKKKRQLREKIQPFVHVLVPTYEADNERIEWHGRTLDLQRRFRREVRNGMKGTMTVLRKVVSEQKRIQKAIKDVKKHQRNMLKSTTLANRGSVERGLMNYGIASNILPLSLEIPSYFSDNGDGTSSLESSEIDFDFGDAQKGSFTKGVEEAADE